MRILHRAVEAKSATNKLCDLTRDRKSSFVENRNMSKTILGTENRGRYAITDEGTASFHLVNSQSTGRIMSTGRFLSTLRAAELDQRLIFQLNQSPLVAPGYHVTEVKAVSYDTMDCGGVADSWQETVIQLWNPGDEPTREYMTVRKFLAIYDRVARHVPISNEAELRFEYGDVGQPACIYRVQNIEMEGELIFVHLRAPVVTCKARDRKQVDSDVAKAKCCG
jgi:hypothetical protein